MRTACLCALLAAAAWLVSVGSRHHDTATVFAIVWTAMAGTYFARGLRRGGGVSKHW